LQVGWNDEIMIVVVVFFQFLGHVFQSIGAYLAFSNNGGTQHSTQLNSTQQQQQQQQQNTLRKKKSTNHNLE
jgi:hypothetical protein